MLINHQTTSTSIDMESIFADGLTYINTFQWLLAYISFEYLYQNTKRRSVSSLYNMSLCHHQAKEYTKAVALLENALTQMSAPTISHTHTNYLPNELLIQEYQDSHYQLAVTESAIILNPEVIKLRIRRLLVDLHLELRHWQEIIRLYSLPEMENCKNVQKALALAKSNT